jgi:predicted RNA-binding protein with PUA-like domain
MQYWLIKSEPNVWSYDQQVAKGSKGEAWTGIRNHTAKLNLMKMKKGDRAFFYHSNIGKEIVGIVEIVREHYPDPSAKPGDPWVAVDVVAREKLPKPVTLEAIAKTKLAEGVYTASVLNDLAKRHDVDMPIVAAIADVLEGRASVEEVIGRLLTRPFRAET